MLNELKRKCKVLSAAVKQVGIIGIITRGCTYLIRNLVNVDNYYIEFKNLREEDEKQYLPSVENYCVHVICTSMEVDKLELSVLVLGII